MIYCARFLFLSFLAGRAAAATARRTYTPLGAAILAVTAFPLASAAPNASVVYPKRTLAMGNQSGGITSKEEVKIEHPKPQVTFSEEELRQRLSDQEYHVTQERGTERAWTGKYVKVSEDGVFTCVVCGTELFKTDTKFESGSGWPSFSDVAKKGSVTKVVDESHGMRRIEAVCTKCGAHLGHVFDDGPTPSGLRFCINSASLKFNPDKVNKEDSTDDK